MIGVSINDAKGFGNVWRTPGGLAVPMDDTHLQFATDFANVVLRNFVQQAQLAQQAAMKAAQEKAAAASAPQVVLTD